MRAPMVARPVLRFISAPSGAARVGGAAMTGAYISAEELIELLLGERGAVAVVDVRDEDRLGGHIAGSIHAPSSSLDDRVLDQLADRLATRRVVVFHCMKSQIRGPSSLAMFRKVMEKRRQEPGPRLCLLVSGFERFAKVATRHAHAQILLEAMDDRVWPQWMLTSMD